MSEQRVERRLAAILAADVAGYGRLMGADEEGTLAALKGHRRELIDPLIAQHRGRIFKTTGDGILIEFASVVDAVRCAVVMQQGMEDRTANLPETERICFRVGINLGDVIIDEGDIFGDGVNVAARLQALAEPGAICVSASVREQLGEKLPIGFADLGEHNVKNIARPVRVYRVEARPESRATAGDPKDAPLPLPDRPSIAVLPFVNMSGDPEQEYFVDGMVEDIITGLSRIKWLFVIARNSSFAYKGKSPDIRQVGRDLGVHYVLEGSVRRAANRVRITGQLIEAESGRHIWAERYDRAMDDIFALQDEITLSVVGAIEPSLRLAEVERIKRKRPDNLDAYDLVLRAWPHVNKAMPEEARIAVTLLERALELEAGYALAHGYLAWCNEILFLRGGRDPKVAAAAVKHARAAIAHGCDDATALGLAGFALAMVGHDRPAALEAFETALALSPSCNFALMMGAVAMGWSNQPERAIEWGERAVRLSPFDPQIYGAYIGISVAHFSQQRFEEAAVAARRAVQSNPAFSVPYTLLTAALAAAGHIPEAKVAAAQVLALEPGFSASYLQPVVGVPAELADRFAEAWQAAGLPK